jgi:hypothetical protein
LPLIRLGDRIGERNPKRLRVAIAASLLFCALPTSAFAQAEVIIYRCTDANGNVSLQNDRPCPAGYKQDIRMVGTLPTTAPTAPSIPRPAPSPTPAATVAQPVPPPQAIVPAPQPPPALFQCRTWDDRDYYGDTADPPATCAPLQAVDSYGNPIRSNVSACETKRDTCTAVEPDQRCRAWKRRLDEAEFRWRFAGGHNDERKADFDRIAKIYRESTCAR